MVRHQPPCDQRDQTNACFDFVDRFVCLVQPSATADGSDSRRLIMNRCRPLSLIAYRVSRAAFCVLLTAFCLLPSAFGQSATATLSGTVLDPNGAVVPTATITVT